MTFSVSTLLCQRRATLAVQVACNFDPDFVKFGIRVRKISSPSAVCQSLVKSRDESKFPCRLCMGADLRLPPCFLGPNSLDSAERNGAMASNSAIPLRLTFCLAVWILLFCFTKEASSGGLETYIVGARGKVMGGAITATADDPSAVFYNPAGLVTLKQGPLHWEASAAVTYIDYSFEDKHDLGRAYESELVPIIPAFFLSKTFSSNLAAGFGVYVPWGGGGVDYGETSPTQPIQEGYLALVAFTPAISYRISPEVSIGMGLSGYYGKVEQTFVVGFTVEEEFSGYAGWNAHFGVLFKPGDKINFGLLMRTPTDVNLDGDSITNGLAKQDATLEFKLPAKFSVGLSYRLSASLLLATNFSYIFYDDFDEMTTQYQSGLMTRAETGYQNYIDTGIAAEYSGLDPFTFRGSIRYSQSGTRNEYINAFTNDVDYLLFDIGIGYKIGKNLEFICNLGYNWGFDASNANGEYGAYQVVSQFGFRTTY